MLVSEKSGRTPVVTYKREVAPLYCADGWFPPGKVLAQATLWMLCRLSKSFNNLQASYIQQLLIFVLSLPGWARGDLEGEDHASGETAAPGS